MHGTLITALPFLIYVISPQTQSRYYGLMENLTHKQLKDVVVLAQFIEIFCKKHHLATAQGLVSRMLGYTTVTLCPDCLDLLDHAIMKRQCCPLDPKPSCKKCPIHCYSKEYRLKIRKIMAYSGRTMILRGRLDYLWHYFF
jgi:hypothetical protein